jgi:hypothetical protein
MSELDDLDEGLTERIREQGECVCSIHWDSGAPGSGAGVDSIYKFKDEYWLYSDGDLSGPFEFLAEAMDGFGITDATESIYSTEVTATELATRVELYDPSSGHRIEINGEQWEVSPDGKLERAGDRKSA